MIHYTKCGNCGKFFDSSGGVVKNWCSRSCAVKYVSCRNCGRYFEKKSSTPYCSGECSNSYKITQGETKK